MKTVGVVLAAYNGETFLEDQVNSILRQTRLPQKILVVDDRSRDGTKEIIRKYVREFPKLFRLLENERNLGAKKTFEIGISACDTDYIALCDQDDVWEPEKIDLLYDTIESNRKALLCFHDLKLIDHRGTPVGKSFWEVSLPHERLPVTGARARRRLVNLSNPVPGCSMFFSTKLKKHILPMPPSKWIGHDWWISVAAFFLGAPVFVGDALTRYRLHADQTAGIGTVFGKNGTGHHHRESLSYKVKREIRRILNWKVLRGNLMSEQSERMLDMSLELLKMIEKCKVLNNEPARFYELDRLEEKIRGRLENLPDMTKSEDALRLPG